MLMAIRANTAPNWRKALLVKIFCLGGGIAAMLSSSKAGEVGKMVGLTSLREATFCVGVIEIIFPSLSTASRNARANSEIELKRSSGSFDKARSSTSSSSLEMRGLMLLGGNGGTL